MKSILEILKEHHIGKVYDLFIFYDICGVEYTNIQSTTDHNYRNERVEQVRLTVNDVKSQLDDTDAEWFWLTFNETDKILHLI